jgi:putative hydrolase of the HAD superfamily
LQIQAAAFDIDGTLYSNRMMYVHSLPSFMRHPLLVYHFGKVRKEIRKGSYGGDFHEAQARLLSRSMNIGPEKAAYLIDHHLYGVWERSFRRLRPLPGVRDTLLALKRRGLPLASLSDFPVQRKLDYLGLEDLMDVAFCSEDTGHLKPHPAPFNRLVHDLGVPAEGILYVGNSYRYDIIGAAEAGLKTAYFTSRPDRKGVADKALSAV